MLTRFFVSQSTLYLVVAFGVLTVATGVALITGRRNRYTSYLRYLWVADGQRGWDAFGEPVYTTREAWMSFVSARRMRRYR